MACENMNSLEQHIGTIFKQLWIVLICSTNAEEEEFKGWDLYQPSNPSEELKGDTITICHRRRNDHGPLRRYKQKKIKAQSIDFTRCTTINLIAYDGRIPCKNNQKTCTWKEVELATSPDLLQNIKLAMIDQRAKVIRLLENFPNLEVLRIIIEVPYSQRDHVYSAWELVRIQPLLAFPGARVFVAFETTGVQDHPSVDLVSKWQESWSQALQVESDDICRLNIADRPWKEQ